MSQNNNKNPNNMRNIMAATSKSMSRGVAIWPLFAFGGLGIALAALWKSVFDGA